MYWRTGAHRRIFQRDDCRRMTEIGAFDGSRKLSFNYTAQCSRQRRYQWRDRGQQDITEHKKAEAEVALVSFVSMRLILTQS